MSRCKGQRYIYVLFLFLPVSCLTTIGNRHPIVEALLNYLLQASSTHLRHFSRFSQFLFLHVSIHEAKYRFFALAWTLTSVIEILEWDTASYMKVIAVADSDLLSGMQLSTHVWQADLWLSTFASSTSQPKKGPQVEWESFRHFILSKKICLSVFPAEQISKHIYINVKEVFDS